MLLPLIRKLLDRVGADELKIGGQKDYVVTEEVMLNLSRSLHWRERPVEFSLCAYRVVRLY